jgi:CRP/FNR family transcriptional regulator, anaerobic regulatory protein
LKTLLEQTYGFLFEEKRINDIVKVFTLREFKEGDVTHKEIAYDLHTSRVVISRLLKAAEKEGKIKLQSASIELINTKNYRG